MSPKEPTGALTVAGSEWSSARPMIVAEIGTGHGGDKAKAYELIDAAAESGADCAKFQIVYADEILHPETGFVTLPGGSVRLYDRFRELELDPSFYADMSAYCAKRGILFLCSPFGIRSARELRALAPSFAKIASPELNHFPLLAEVSTYGVPMALSSGVSRLSDIERALEATEGAPGRILLHCVTSYPAPEEDYNLRVLGNLSRIFGIPVGVSDHSLDPVLVPALAITQGAAMVEKHICLSRLDPGLDDPVALPPDQFARMVKAIREAAANPAPVLQGLADEYGEDKVNAVLGNGIKRLAPSERANYGRTNRSLHYAKSLAQGHILGPEDVKILRTEKVLSPGLPPEHLETVVGCALARATENGAGLAWEDLLSRPSPR